MPYCSRCGVEVEEVTKFCPLCQAPIQHFSSASRPGYWLPPEEDQFGKIFPSPREIRARSWLVLILLQSIAALVVMSVNLMNDGFLTWSVVPLIVLGSTMLYTTMIFRYFASFLKMFLSLILITTLLLGLLDLIGQVRWFLPLGLPVMALILVLFVIEYVLFKKSKPLGYNIPGFLLTGITLLCIGIDLLTLTYTGSPRVSWSTITAATLLPFSIFFLFLHYGRKKIIDLGRFFHY